MKNNFFFSRMEVNKKVKGFTLYYYIGETMMDTSTPNQKVDEATPFFLFIITTLYIDIICLNKSIRQKGT